MPERATLESRLRDSWAGSTEDSQALLSFETCLTAPRTYRWRLLCRGPCIYHPANNPKSGCSERPQQGAHAG